MSTAADVRGLKRVCVSCGIRFYDMNKRPIVCPSCDTEFTGEIKLKARRGRVAAADTEAEGKVSKKAVKEVIVDDDDDLDDEDGAEIVSLEDAEEVDDDDLDDDDAPDLDLDDSSLDDLEVDDIDDDLDDLDEDLDEDLDVDDEDNTVEDGKGKKK